MALLGKTISFETKIGDSTVSTGHNGDYIVGNGTEINVTHSSGTIGFAVPVVDFGDSNIVLTGDSVSPAFFNGYINHFYDRVGDIHNIVGATLQETVADTDLTASDLTFDANNVYLDLTNVAVAGAERITLSLQFADAKPVFAGSSSPSVAENSTDAGALTFTDADNDPLTYAITGGADQAGFRLTGGNHLSFVQAPDFEAPGSTGGGNTYLVQVTATDDYGGSVSQTLSVAVTNVDEPPVFASGDFFSLADDSATGSVVGDVDANDGDGGAADAGITYSIVGGNDDGAFAIGSDGKITVADSSKLRDAELTVRADDGHSHTDQDVAVVLFHDSLPPPHFTALGPFSVPENSPNGTVVGDVNAAVGNGPDDAGVSYALTGDGTFAIDSSTGVITVANSANLDFETQSTIRVTITATNSEAGAGAIVPISVTDVAEIPTLFTAGNDGRDLNGFDLSLYTMAQATHALAGNDTVTLSETQDLGILFFGDDGDDVITGSSHGDRIEGDAGHDTVLGGNGTDTLWGKDDIDSVSGGNGSDVVYGGNGNDSVGGADDSDRVYGDSGSDRVFGGNADDSVFGGTDSDSVMGDAGNDSLYGGDGADTVTGGAGNDRLFGGAGVDRLTGSAGADRFVVTQAADSAAAMPDTITDFVHGTDKVDLSLLGSLHFIGSHAFTAADQVREIVSGGHTLLQVNLVGASGAELAIAFSTAVNVTESDLLL